MASKSYTRQAFSDLRQREGWKAVAQLQSADEVRDFLLNDFNAAHQAFGKFAMGEFSAISSEIMGRAADGGFALFLDQSGDSFFATLTTPDDPNVTVWTCYRTADAKARAGAQPPIDGVEPPAPAPEAALLCLARLGNIAGKDHPSLHVLLGNQDDAAFMWKAPSVHPLQVMENHYQRVVLHAVAEARAQGRDANRAQSDTLGSFFAQSSATPEAFNFTGEAVVETADDMSAVRMNHLIDKFYLFRLLVPYRVSSENDISEELRAELSGNLTKLLHSRDRAQMGWLSTWLTAKLAELGKIVNSVNSPSKKRVIFFLKGGRALNYFLRTPENGENDWDTQVVINPHLPVSEWYETLGKVHDLILSALSRFKAEFSQLVRSNAEAFGRYLDSVPGVFARVVDEVNENDAQDRAGQENNVNCKAELIDIGIPRRDSASALEEWSHLSAPGALLESGGVIFPHREYYRNEYLMMIRDCFLPSEDVRKAPKRVTRFGLVLASAHAGPSPKEQKQLDALPQTKAAIARLDSNARQELFGEAIVPQFVEAYNLLQDPGLATHVDQLCASSIDDPRALDPRLAAVLDAAQGALARDVGVAHVISTRMTEHWAARDAFFEQNAELFRDVLGGLYGETRRALGKVGAQFAVAGSFAARLQAKHLRRPVQGLEPVRRVLVKLQCLPGASADAVLAPVREALQKLVKSEPRLSMVDASEEGRASLLVYWNQDVTLGAFTYRPLVMKIRVAEQKGAQLPVLSALNGLPVLDLRYVAADYLRKTAKIDERGARGILQAATTGVAELLSNFDFSSDEG